MDQARGCSGLRVGDCGLRATPVSMRNVHEGGFWNVILLNNHSASLPKLAHRMSSVRRVRGA